MATPPRFEDTLPVEEAPPRFEDTVAVEEAPPRFEDTQPVEEAPPRFEDTTEVEPTPAVRATDVVRVPMELVKGAAGAVTGAATEVPLGLKLAATEGSRELAQSDFQEGGLGAIDLEIKRLERAKAKGQGVSTAGSLRGLIFGSAEQRRIEDAQRAEGFKAADEDRLATLRTQREQVKGRIAELESRAESEMRAIMAARQDRAETFGPVEGASKLAQMANIGGNALGSLAVAYGLGPGFGSTYLAAQQGVDTYITLRDRGLSHEQAVMKATLDGAVSAQLEKLPLDVLKDGVAGMNRVIRGAAGALAEGGQEVAQQVSSNLIRGDAATTGLDTAGGAGAFAGAVIGLMTKGRTGPTAAQVRQSMDWKADTAATLTRGLRDTYGITDQEVLGAVDRRMQAAQTPEELAALYADIDALVAAERGEVGPVAEDLVAEAAMAQPTEVPNAQQEEMRRPEEASLNPTAAAVSPESAPQPPASDQPTAPDVMTPDAAGPAAGGVSREVVGEQVVESAPPVTAEGDVSPSAEPIVDQRPAAARGNEGFRVRYKNTDQTPLIDFLVRRGGITPKGKDYRGGEYDGAPTLGQLGGFGPLVFGGRGTVGRVDVIAQEAYDTGLIQDPSPDALWQALDQEVKSYRSAREQDKADRKQYAEMQREAKAQGREFKKDVLAERKRRQAVPVADLKVGDQVSIGRTKIRVADVDADTGDVVLENGKRYGLQLVRDGQVLYVDKAKLQPVGEVDFPTLDVFDAPVEQQNAAAGDVPETGQPKPGVVQGLDNPVRAVDPRTGQTELIGQDEGGFRLVGEEAPDVAGQMAAERAAEAARADAEARQGQLFEQPAAAETKVDFPAKRREVVQKLGPQYAKEFDRRVTADGARSAVAWADRILPDVRDLGDGVVARRDEAGVWQIQSPDSPLDIPLRWDNPDHAEILREADPLGNEQRVRSEVGKLQAGWKGVRVEVVENVEALGPEDAAEVRQKLGDGGAEGVFIQGRGGKAPRVVVFAGAVTPARAVKVALHEAVGHAGLRGVMGTRFPRFLDQVFNGAPRAQLRAIANQYGLDLGTEAGRQEAAEEWMAQLAENRIDHPDMWARVVAGVRQWLRDMGIVRGVTDTDIAVMMYRARQFAEGRRGAAADAGGAVVRGSKFGPLVRVGQYEFVYGPGYNWNNPVQAKKLAERHEASIESIKNDLPSYADDIIRIADTYRLPLNYDTSNRSESVYVEIGPLKIRFADHDINYTGLDFARSDDTAGSRGRMRFDPVAVESNLRNRWFPTKQKEIQSGSSALLANANRTRGADQSVPEKNLNANMGQTGTGVNTIRFSQPDSPQQRGKIIAARKRILEAEGKKLSAFTERMSRDQRISVQQAKAALINPKSERIPQNLAELKESLAGMTEATLDSLITFSPNLQGPVEVRGQVVAGLAIAEKLNRRLAAGQDPVDVLGEGAEVGRVAAQVLRQMAEIKSTTPAGMVGLVESLAAKEGRMLTTEQRDKLAELAEVRIKHQRAYEAAGKLHYDLLTDQTADAYAFAEKQAYAAAVAFERQAARLLPVRLGDQISAFIRGNLLTVKSHVMNLYGNMEWFFIRGGAQAVGSGVDFVYTAVKRSMGYEAQRTLLNPLAGARAFGAGLREGGRDFVRTMKHGASTVAGERVTSLHPLTALRQAWTGEDIAVDAKTGAVRGTDRALKALEGIFGILPETNLRLLALADAPMRSARQKQVLFEMGKLRGLEGKALERFVTFPDSIPINLVKGKFPKGGADRNATTIAERAAAEAVFQEDNWLATGYQAALVGIERKHPDVGPQIRTLSTTFFPYVKTPTNLLFTGVQLIMPELSIANAIFHASMGNRREVNMALGRAAMGVSLMTAAQILIRLGALIGDDESERVRNLTLGLGSRNAVNLTHLRRKLAGEPGDTWQPGDDIRDLRGMGFIGLAFSAHANSYRRAELAGENEGLLVNPWAIFNPEVRMSSAAVAVKELPLLRGTAGILQALQTPSEESFNRWLRQYSEVLTSAALPNNLAALNRMTWDYIPERTGDRRIDSFANVVKARLFMSDQMVLKRDLFGRPIAQNPQGSTPWVYQFLDITRARKFPNDPMYNTLYEIYRSTLDPDVIPSQPGRVVKNPWTGREEKLTMREYERYLTIIGQTREYLMRFEMQQPRWADLPDAVKADRLKRVFDQGRTEGVRAYWQSLNMQANRRHMKPVLQQIVDAAPPPGL